MTEYTADLHSADNPIETAADLGRRDAERMPEAYDLAPGTSIVVVRERSDEGTVVHDLESYLPAPRQPRGCAILHDPSDFTTYVNRLTDTSYTTVWADVDAGSVTAVLDDHMNSDEAGWRQHIVGLRLRPDVDWQHWIKLNGKAVRQAEFAQHIEDALHTIIRPDGATMLEVAMSLQATRSAEFSQASRLDNNDLQLAYHEDTTAKAGRSGNLEVPREFALHITPWIGCPMLEVIAKLRYEINGGNLTIGYKLVRPDLAKIEVFESLVATMAENLAVGKVLNGTAPLALR